MRDWPPDIDGVYAMPSHEVMERLLDEAQVLKGCGFYIEEGTIYGQPLRPSEVQDLIIYLKDDRYHCELQPVGGPPDTGQGRSLMEAVRSAAELAGVEFAPLIEEPQPIHEYIRDVLHSDDPDLWMRALEVANKEGDAVALSQVVHHLKSRGLDVQVTFSSEDTCSHCRGSGQVRRRHDFGRRLAIVHLPCTVCSSDSPMEVVTSRGDSQHLHSLDQTGGSQSESIDSNHPRWSMVHSWRNGPEPIYAPYIPIQVIDLGESPAAQDMVTVQPMAAPIGDIFTYEHEYDDGQGSREVSMAEALRSALPDVVGDAADDEVFEEIERAIRRVLAGHD